MKRVLSFVGVFLAGGLLGALLALQSVSMAADADLAARRAELKALESDLALREAELASGWKKVKENQRSLSRELTQALSLADQVSGSQKSTIERLKAVIVTLRRLIAELPGSEVN